MKPPKLVTLFLLSALAVAAHATERLTPQLVLSLGTVEEVALSPDGRTAAFTLNRPPARPAAGAKNGTTLWTVSVSGGKPQPVPDAGEDPVQPRWSPDGGRLAWIAARASSPKRIQIRGWPDGRISEVPSTGGPVVRFEWAHDGKRLAFVASDAPTEEQRAREAAGQDWIVVDAPPLLDRLYVADLRSGRMTARTAEGLNVEGFDWSPDDAQLAFVAAPTPSGDDHELSMRLYQVGTSEGTPQQVGGQMGRIDYPLWTDDGRSIVYLANTSVEDPWPGSVFIVATGDGEAPRNITPGHDGTTMALSHIPGRANTMAVLLEEHLHTVLRPLDTRRGSMGPAFSTRVNVNAPASFSRDGRTYAVPADSAQHPSEVFVGATSRVDSLRRLTTSNESLADISLAAQEEVAWLSKDGTRIEGLLIKPAGFQAGVRYPVVLHVHGGSESSIVQGWHADYHDMGQLLAARGIMVLYPNYRGSRGRGVDYIRGNRHDLMGREWEDIESGLDYLIAQKLADGKRAGIYGFSWGGYAAGWGATYASQRFVAGVGGAGLYDWISEAGSNDTRMHEQLVHWGGPLYRNFLLYLERSPIYHIGHAQTPFLMLHGALDPSCPINQAIEMDTALKWRGAPHQLVIYPREGHGVAEVEHQRDWLGRALDWLERYLLAQPVRASR